MIVVKESTSGEPGAMTVGELPELRDIITVTVNDKKVELPKFAQVNGALQSIYYDIQENDEITLANYYTLKQIAEFMDVILDPQMNLYVNNKAAELTTPVYENFSVTWTLEELRLADVDSDKRRTGLPPESVNMSAAETAAAEIAEAAKAEASAVKTHTQAKTMELPVLTVLVNGDVVELSGKQHYVFVDIFDFIDFDLSDSRGRNIVTRINGHPAQYMEPLGPNDVLEIYWRRT